MPNGEVPESAKLAIQQARRNGHLVCLCTGRSKPEMVDNILAIGFDGIIGAGGGYIEMDDKIVHHETMPKEAVMEIVNYFNSYNIGYYLESNDDLFGSDNCVEAIHARVTKGLTPLSEAYIRADKEFHWFCNLLNQYKNKTIDYENVNKISFISNEKHPFHTITNKFSKRFTIYQTTVPQFGKNSGEIAVKGVDKAQAVQFVLKQLNIPKHNTMAYGDGDNDIKMFEAVNYGVAMENATKNLKRIAKEITSRAEGDGIFLSFQRNHLISP